MNIFAKMGASAAVLAFGMAMSAPAQAIGFPPYACTAANQGEIYELQEGPYRYGQAYRITRWECSDNQWFLFSIQLCDYYGSGCIEL
jgi:hypothetical protein